MAEHISLRPGGVLVAAALCAHCGQPARGLATIGDVRYCHEGESPTCYERASGSTYTSLHDFIFRDPDLLARIPLD